MKASIQWIAGLLLSCSNLVAFAQLPAILTNKKVQQAHYLPDYSYAGYHHGEKALSEDFSSFQIFDARNFGVVPDDELDDSRALLKMMDSVNALTVPVLVQLPAGKIIVSEVIYIERSHVVIKGAGNGPEGTTIYCPRPMMYFKDPDALAELREYLLDQNKRQIEPQNNIDLAFSQYSWSGGIFWTRVPNVRTKDYLDAYDQPPQVMAKCLAGKRGERSIQVASSDALIVGQVVQLVWYNREGPNGSLIGSIYGQNDLKVGSHHWNYPTHALVRQPTTIRAIKGNKIEISDPLLHEVKPEWGCELLYWPHLEEVGFADFQMVFPDAPVVAHHVEQGFNAIYLTRLMNGWVSKVSIENADSGILTEESANLTISQVETRGPKLAHYSVAMSGVHNVLVDQLQVRNRVRHSLSFNTYATRSVYKDCLVWEEPVLDQHSGANHQNLFDHITVYVGKSGETSFAIFGGGGAPYWKPSHGAYSTFWNLNVIVSEAVSASKIYLHGMKDGANARIIGIHANVPFELDYQPTPYLEMVNQPLSETPSLYSYQLNKRLGKE